MMWMMQLSPRDMADIYSKTIGAMTDSYSAYIHLANNIFLASLESTQKAMSYASQNSMEMARIASGASKILGQTARESTRA